MGAAQHQGADRRFGTKRSDVMAVNATIIGQEFIALNGGPILPQTEVGSFQIHCDTQEEVDHYWDSLLASGGKPSQYGWLKYRFGVAWQLAPIILEEVMANGDDDARGRVTAAFMSMQKLDVAAIKAAAEA
jgi:predicted 3-demethylubiquinone-9 3-methyltransferase (glyoxalase superfamily)